MGIKNLTVLDPYSTPVANSEYFFPLELKMDPVERDAFWNYFENTMLANVGSNALYSPMRDAKTHLPRTLIQTNEFLKPLNLQVRNFTVFVSAADAVGKNIHVDGTQQADGTDVVLEARLSYYEMACAPGIIRWFPKTEEYIKEIINKPGMYALHWLLPWITDLKQGRVNWDGVPDYAFATSTNTPSALLRTNLPHHVIQGPGVRLTISGQLVFADTLSPVGVWDHIEKNFNLLGV
jgi:hypothetical protein